MSVHIEAHNIKGSVFVSCEENCLHFTLLIQVNYTAVGLELPKILHVYIFELAYLSTKFSM